jgi:hypothetical protein
MLNASGTGTVSFDRRKESDRDTFYARGSGVQTPVCLNICSRTRS